MKEELDITGHYVSGGKVVVRRIGADRLLVPVSGTTTEEHAVYPLNETGLFIWERMIEGRSIDETAVSLASLYRISKEQALADCSDFVEQLIDEGLLKADVV